LIEKEAEEFCREKGIEMDYLDTMLRIFVDSNEPAWR
jgi:hypothetical protein